MPFVEVDGLRIRYRHAASENPAAPTVLLLHMAGSSSVGWSAVCHRLGDGIEALAPDLPGHGQSGGEPLSSIPQMAAFAARFLDVLGLRRVWVGGHSMGGAVALQLTLDAPSRVRGLLLVATAARLKVAPAILQLLQTQPEALPALFEQLGGVSTARLPAAAEAVFPQTSTLGLQRDFSACDGLDLSERLAEIRCPASVLVGRDDMMTPPRWAERLADGLPGGVLFIEDGCGHLLPRQRAPWVAEALKTLLTRPEQLH